MFYLMSWVREKLEKKHINNETHSAGEGKTKEEEEKKNLVWGSSANRSEGPFEVCCFSAVNSLRTCVISECKASLDFFLPENAKYLAAAAAAQCLAAVLERQFRQPRKKKSGPRVGTWVSAAHGRRGYFVNTPRFQQRRALNLHFSDLEGYYN